MGITGYSGSDMHCIINVHQGCILVDGAQEEGIKASFIVEFHAEQRWWRVCRVHVLANLPLSGGISTGLLRSLASLSPSNLSPSLSLHSSAVPSDNGATFTTEIQPCITCANFYNTPTRWLQTSSLQTCGLPAVRCTGSLF